MRIGLVLECFNPLRGGLEQWSYQFAKHMADRGHQLHLIAESFGNFEDHPAWVRHPLPKSRTRLARAEAAAVLLQRLPLDIVHDMGIGWYGDLLHLHGGAWQALFERNLELTPTPIRQVKRAISPLLPRYRDFHRLLEKQFRCHGPLKIALSKLVAEHLQQYHHVQEDQLRLVYNGVDCERFHPKNKDAYREAIREQYHIADHETLLLIVAHNFRLKGVPTLLAAMRNLVNAGHSVRLLVAGGKRLDSWKRLVHRQGIGHAIQFLGGISDPMPLYAAADAYVHPTWYDTCSLVVLEALATGLPVITTRCNGVADLISPGIEGYLLTDPGDDVLLAQHIEPLLQPIRREVMGVEARKLALAHSFEKQAEQFLTIYEEIKQTHRPRLAA
ncbi:Hypothetical protein PBC10988_21240 [Planctomycetales bacterium 10988]|nr:Hypothetical protein PBC10988_21240 [Planctomycetales bacterium 10988]